MSWLTHHSIGLAQILLSSIFIAGYFTLLIFFMRGEVHVPGEYHDSFQVLLGVLTAGVGTIVSFWFQRVRGDPTSDKAQPVP